MSSPITAQMTPREADAFGVIVNIAVNLELANRMKAIMDTPGGEVVDLKRGAS